MRDIRQDLKERIAAEFARREPHQDALKQIDENVANLQRLLEIEEGRNVNGAQKTAPSRPTVTLDDYLTKQLGKGPKTLKELTAAAIAAGYFAGSKESPGRAIHGKLLNPMKAGTITRDTDRERRYRMADNE
jgi:hypothetical protein